MNPKHERDMDLMGRYLAGAAGEDEVRTLEQRMAADADLRRDFLSHANIDATLPSSVQPLRRRRRRWCGCRSHPDAW